MLDDKAATNKPSSEKDENSELLKEYQIMLKVAKAHMKKCVNFEKEVLREFEFNE